MSDSSHLKIIAHGFPELEQRLIDTTVRISKDREPSLSLLTINEARKADIILINGLDRDALTWAKDNYEIIKDSTVIWIDEDPMSPKRNHVKLNRPILWVNLPIILARVLEEIDLKSQTESSQEVLSEVPAPTSVSSSSLLVVDDSQAVRNHLNSVLTQNNYKVVTAESGEDALEKVALGEFDCILMDVLMPGIDGYKACREILSMKQGDNCPSVIMLTSKSSPFDKIRGKMSGCAAYLTKPVKPEVLLKTVANCISNG